MISRRMRAAVQAARSRFPLPDMTTTAAGLLYRRDLHPLERRLASLQEHPET
jgi:hypothetical protein